MVVITEDERACTLSVDKGNIIIRPIYHTIKPPLMIRPLVGYSDGFCWLTSTSVRYTTPFEYESVSIGLSTIATEDEPLRAEDVLDMCYTKAPRLLVGGELRYMILLHCTGNVCYKIECGDHHVEQINDIEAISPTSDNYAVVLHGGELMKLKIGDDYDDLMLRSLDNPMTSHRNSPYNVLLDNDIWMSNHRIKIFNCTFTNRTFIATKNTLFVASHGTREVESCVVQANYNSSYGNIIHVFVEPAVLVLTDTMHIVTISISGVSVKYGPYITATTVCDSTMHRNSVLCVKSQTQGDLFSQHPINNSLVVTEVSIPCKIVSTELDVGLCYPTSTKRAVG